MNLNDIAQFVCRKIRKSDTESVDRCKDFLRQRHQMLWDDQLWRDSLAQMDVTIDPENDALHAEGIVLLPKLIDRVVALRTANRELVPTNLEVFYRADMDVFEQSGAPAAFSVLSPVVWQSATPTHLKYLSTNDDDVGIKLYVRWTDSENNSHEAEFTADTIFALALYGDVPGGNTAISIEAFSKPISQLPMSISDDAGSPNILNTLLETETHAVPHPRVRLFQKPKVATTLRVLAKRKAPVFNSDHDEPALRNSQNCLISFAQGDMLQRERQYAKAQTAYNEANALLEQLKRIEVHQRASNIRLIPEGDDSAAQGAFLYTNSTGD